MTNRELSPGEQMLNAFDLATARGKRIEEMEQELVQERAAHEATKAEIARVSAERDQVRAEKRVCEAAFEMASERICEVDALLFPYQREGAPTNMVALLKYVLTMLQQGTAVSA